MSVFCITAPLEHSWHRFMGCSLVSWDSAWVYSWLRHMGCCFSPVECTVDIDTMVPACLQWLDLSLQLIETHGVPACLLLWLGSHVPPQLLTKFRASVCFNIRGNFHACAFVGKATGQAQRYQGLESHWGCNALHDLGQIRSLLWNEAFRKREG